MELIFSLLFYVASIIIVSIVCIVAVSMAEKRINERMDNWHEMILRRIDDDLDNAMGALNYHRMTEFYPTTGSGVTVTSMREIWVKIERKSE
jgi:F0F1-type ATP synthase membrane subunit a